MRSAASSTANSLVNRRSSNFGPSEVTLAVLPNENARSLSSVPVVKMGRTPRLDAARTAFFSGVPKPASSTGPGRFWLSWSSR